MIKHRITLALPLALLLVSPAAAAPSKALKKRLASLAELEQSRAAALELIRDDVRYVKGAKQVQAQVDRLTAKVSKAFRRVDSLLTKDLKKLRKKRAACEALVSARPETLNAWERALLQKARDMDVMAVNAALRKGKKGSLVFQLEQVRLTNEYRVLMGLNALRFESLLVNAAQGHSDEMVRLDYFDHTSPTAGRESPFRRATVAGFDGSAVGENIAHGYRSPRDVHVGWLTSPGHHRNIVDADWEVMGVAFCRDYWTQVFGRVTPLASS